MIKCPKCHFEQPPDSFCANCGVNMQTFKQILPGPRPMYIIAVVLTICGIAFVGYKIIRSMEQIQNVASTSTDKIFENYTQELEKRSPPREPHLPTAPSQSPSIASGAANAKFMGLRPPVTAPIVSPEGPSSPNPPQAPLEQTQAPPPPEASPPPAEKITNQLMLEFVLASKETMEKIPLPVGRIGSAIFLKSKFEGSSKEPGFQILSSESHSLTTGQGIIYVQGTQEPRTKENIGFNIEITLLRLTDGAADYKIIIKRSLPEITPQGQIRVASQEFAETVTIAAGSLYGISGLLPRKTLVENEDMLYKTNILRTFLEPGFQKFEEEFAIFFIP